MAEPDNDGRAMRLAKKAGVVAGLCSAVVGLVFVFFPGLKPEPEPPTADRSAAITGVVMNPSTTRGQFLDYSDQSKLGFTRQQLAEVGASAFARVRIAGFRGATLTLERQIVDARSGDVVGQARDFLVRPSADKVTHRWWDWAPLHTGRGRYVMVIKLLDESAKAAIACGQTRAFGGRGGLARAQTPRLCERQ
jgi:hypothetical protein